MSINDSLLYEVRDSIFSKLGLDLDVSVVKYIISLYFSKIKSDDAKDIMLDVYKDLHQYSTDIDDLDLRIIKESLKGSIGEYSKDIMCATLRMMYDTVSVSTKKFSSKLTPTINSRSINTDKIKGVQPTEEDFDGFEMDFSSIPKSSSVGITPEVVSQMIADEEARKADIEARKSGKKNNTQRQAYYPSNYSSLDNSVFAINIGDVLSNEDIKPLTVNKNVSGNMDDEEYVLQRSDASMLTNNFGNSVLLSTADEDILDY